MIPRIDLVARRPAVDMRAMAGVAVAVAVLAARADPPPADVAAAAVPGDFAAFDEGLGGAVAARLGGSARHWRQIAPAVHQLALRNVLALAPLDAAERTAAVAALAEFIDAKRAAFGGTPVLAEGRTVIGLLDPAHGLGPREITTIADAYGCEPTVFKRDGIDTLEDVADSFLAAVKAALAAGKPTTVIVLGHGLPTEIQSYHIRFERLAGAILDGAAGARRAGEEGPRPIDLSQLVVICDDCFSADFHVNLLTELAREAGRRGRPLGSLPACIAGTNHSSVGHADVGEKFVPYFWRDVIELCFVRRPLPDAVTLGDFFGKVDNMMYGYGRAPIVEDGHVTGYRLVNAELVQDPVVFVPLDEADLAELRRILGLPPHAPLPRWLDVG